MPTHLNTQTVVVHVMVALSYQIGPCCDNKNLIPAIKSNNNHSLNGLEFLKLILKNLNKKIFFNL